MLAAHPVEQVSWTACVGLLRRHRMQLPTEAQWEYGCRAGTVTPWGVEYEALASTANVADKLIMQEGLDESRCAPWSDGHLIHAPVGAYAMNAFGLHDMQGNVWEWCRDGLTADYGGERPGDGLRVGGAPDLRIERGGSFESSPRSARVSARSFDAPENVNRNRGLRGARMLGP